MNVTRSLPVTLELANPGKLSHLDLLQDEFRKGDKFFFSLFKNNEYTEKLITKDVYSLFKSNLSSRYKQCVAKQSLGTYKSWKTKYNQALKENTKLPKNPRFKNINMTLDQRFVSIQKSKDSSFDFWLVLSGFGKRGSKIYFPFNSYKHLNTYLENWNMCKSVNLYKKNNKWYATLIFDKEIETLLPKHRPLGIDPGINKTLVDSNGREYGKKQKSLYYKLKNKIPGSNEYKKLKAQIKNEMGHIKNQLFSENSELDTLIMECLLNIKHGKKNKNSKKFNRLLSYWIISYLVKRIKEKCEILGVQVFEVDPRYTSQTCPLCGKAEVNNRHGERFHCVQCGFADDADYVGALNILHKAESLMEYQKRRLLYHDRLGIAYRGSGIVVPGVSKPYFL